MVGPLGLVTWVLPRPGLWPLALASPAGADGTVTAGAGSRLALHRSSRTAVTPGTAADSRSRSAGGQRAERLVFADVLRAAVIAMVIVHHSAMAYGPSRSSWPVQDPAHSGWFGPLLAVDAAVGMGLLFLLAGYFVPGSCERKGSGRFLRERWARIGMPLLIFVLAVNLPVVYVTGSVRAPASFVRWLYDGGWQYAYLHLWFLAHLLAYTAIYVACRSLARRAGRPPRTLAPSRHAAIAGFVLVLALCTWIIRIWYPVGRWVPLLFVLPAEPAHLPQYISMFALGVLAYRGDWLRRIPTRTGMIWLGIGLAAASSVFAAQAFGWWNDLMTAGGFNLPSLARSTCEALICVGLSIGLIVAFRQTFRRPGRLLTTLAAVSYAAYILHLYIVISLQNLIKGAALPVAAKFTVVAVLGIALSFGLALLSRKIPGIRVILGTKSNGSHHACRSQRRQDPLGEGPAGACSRGRRRSDQAPPINDRACAGPTTSS